MISILFIDFFNTNFCVFLKKQFKEADAVCYKETQRFKELIDSFMKINPEATIEEKEKILIDIQEKLVKYSPNFEQKVSE